MTVTRLLIPALLLGACKDEPPAPIDWCAGDRPTQAASRTPHRGGLTYEIYVRSFRDSDGDGVGDLQGVREKLGYLEDLGVRSIWLMPVFEAHERAGYDPTDLEAVEGDYGDMDDLAALIDDAADRGMEILLDMPLNHSSDRHPWFKAGRDDVEAAEEGWYLWSDHQWDDVRWHKASNDRFYYAFFGADYPDLDWTHPDVADAMRDAMLGWLDRGVGGYRLDAVVQLIEEDDAVGDTDGSHCLLSWLYGELKSEHPDALLLSEAWHESVPGNVKWLGEDDAPEADLIIDVPRRHADEDAWAAGDPTAIADVLAKQIERGVTERLAGYLSAHDTPRFASRVDDAGARRAWMVAHLTLPGQPTLYYGDELDMQDSADWAGHDAPQRGPMPWNDEIYAGFSEVAPWFGVDDAYLDGVNVEAQLADPDSMLSLVRALSTLRAASPALREGALELVEADHGSALAFVRSAGDEQVAVVLNFSASEAPVTLSLDGEWTDLSDGATRVAESGALALGTLPGRGYRVLATSGLSAYAVPAP